MCARSRARNFYPSNANFTGSVVPVFVSSSEEDVDISVFCATRTVKRATRAVYFLLRGKIPRETFSVAVVRVSKGPEKQTAARRSRDSKSK